MAIIHQATVIPGKLDLLAAWLPTRKWYPGDTAEGLERVAAARLDDPAGEVGCEIMLVRAPGGPLVQAAMTYRAAPLDGAEQWLIGTTEHSVLGTRWVYDAVADPVFVAAVAETIRTGGHEAPEEIQTLEGPVRRDPLMRLAGSGDRAAGGAATIVGVDDGDPAVARTDSGTLTLVRTPGDEPSDAALTLRATWDGHVVTLAVLS